MWFLIIVVVAVLLWFIFKVVKTKNDGDQQTLYLKGTRLEYYALEDKYICIVDSEIVLVHDRNHRCNSRSARTDAETAAFIRTIPMTGTFITKAHYESTLLRGGQHQALYRRFLGTTALAHTGTEF